LSLVRLNVCFYEQECFLLVLMFLQRSGEDFLLLDHNAVSRGSGIPTFRRNVLPSSLNANKPMLTFKDEGSIWLHTSGLHLSNDAALSPRIKESSKNIPSQKNSRKERGTKTN